MERTGTPIFISRAVQRGEPVPLLDPLVVPQVPKFPKRYADAHPERINEFPDKIGRLLLDPLEIENQPQDDVWRHELDHDVESVFWLLLYCAMVMQPAEGPQEEISIQSWSYLLGDVEDRETLVYRFKTRKQPDKLIHSVYKPLWTLIKDLATILLVDRHWLPISDVRKRPEYICEAFQRLILQFIDSNRNKDFMICDVGDSLRRAEQVAKSEALSTTPIQRKDGLERENEAKRRCLGRTKDQDDNQSSLMQT